MSAPAESNASRNARSSWRALIGEFGGLAVIWGGEIAGLEAYALPASIVLAGGNALNRSRKGAGFPPFWIAANGGAIGFGLASLLLRERMGAAPFGALCASSLAGLFLWGSFWRVPLVQHLAEQRQGRRLHRSAADIASDVPHLDGFFRIYTRIWAGFFAARAALLIDMARIPAHDPVGGVVLRISLVAMIAASFAGPSLFRLYRFCLRRKGTA